VKSIDCPKWTFRITERSSSQWNSQERAQLNQSGWLDIFQREAQNIIAVEGEFLDSMRNSWCQKKQCSGTGSFWSDPDTGDLSPVLQSQVYKVVGKVPSQITNSKKVRKIPFFSYRFTKKNQWLLPLESVNLGLGSDPDSGLMNRNNQISSFFRSQIFSANKCNEYCRNSNGILLFCFLNKIFSTYITRKITH
jgi:hypothetical protein